MGGWSCPTGSMPLRPAGKPLEGIGGQAPQKLTEPLLESVTGVSKLIVSGVQSKTLPTRLTTAERAGVPGAKGTYGDSPRQVLSRR